MIKTLTLCLVLFTSVTCIKVERRISADLVFKKKSENCSIYEGIWNNHHSCWCMQYKRSLFRSSFRHGHASCGSVVENNVVLSIKSVDGSQNIIQTYVQKHCRAFKSIYIWNTVKEGNVEKGIWVDKNEDVSPLLKFTSQGNIDISFLNLRGWTGQLLYISFQCKGPRLQNSIVIKLIGTITYPFNFNILLNGFTQSPPTLKNMGTTTERETSLTTTPTTTFSSIKSTTQHHTSSTVIAMTTTKNYTSMITISTANQMSSKNITVVISVSIAVLLLTGVVMLALYILWRKRKNMEQKFSPDIKTDKNNSSNDPSNAYALPDVSAYDHVTYSAVSRNRYDTTLSTASSMRGLINATSDVYCSPLNEVYTEPRYPKGTSSQDAYASLNTHYLELIEPTTGNSNINNRNKQNQSIEITDYNSFATPYDTSIMNEVYETVNSTGPKSIKSEEPENVYHILERP